MPATLPRTFNAGHFSACPLLVGLALCLGFPASGEAQSQPSAGSTTLEPCARAELDQAIRSFEDGEFDQVLNLLENNCENARFSDKVESYALLVRVYFARDQLEETQYWIRELLRLNPDYRNNADPAQLISLVDSLRSEFGQVSSVSRTSESLRMAPATVTVVTAEEIARRGYLDLEQVLHDLPGFDISRSNGDLHSNIYLRGYRSSENDRILFLIDGVEENDLWSQDMFLSRQFPMSIIDRVEVVYGPASTMYGPNAFSGVINVITKSADQFLKDGKSYGGEVWVGGGSGNTVYTDATIAGQPSEDVSYTFTTRTYRSDEWDMSGFADWDFLESGFDSVDYRGIFRAQAPDLGEPELTVLSDRAKTIDKDNYNQTLRGSPLGYTDRSRDWSVNGKLRLSRLLLGFQSWRRDEGFGARYTDLIFAGSENGSRYVPQQSFFYVKYDQPLGSDWTFKLFSRFKNHSLGDNSGQQAYVAYANQSLTIDDLRLEIDGVETGKPSSWDSTSLRVHSQQFRSDAEFVYQPNEHLSVVSGLDVATSQIQGDFITLKEIGGELRCGSNTAASPGIGCPATTFHQLDIGGYIQASYTTARNLKFVVGGRLDHNNVQETGGYGFSFNPRLALIYAPERYVLKAIYSEAFKDPSNFNRYSTAPGFRDEPNPNLKPEKVRNMEVSAAVDLSSELTVDVAAYWASYSNGVTPQRQPGGTLIRNEAVGSLFTSGVQTTATWTHDDFLDVYANYTYTRPWNTSPFKNGVRLPIEKLRVGDIASNIVNMGINASWRERLNVNFRLNVVGERKTGQGTTVFDNPFTSIDSHAVTHAAIRYDFLLPTEEQRLGFQFLIGNVLDTDYYDPGQGSADGMIFAARIPQPGRSFSARMIYDF